MDRVSDERREEPSKAILTAALGGLLCLSACVDETINPLTGGTGGAGGATTAAQTTADATVASSSDASTSVSVTSVGSTSVASTTVASTSVSSSESVSASSSSDAATSTGSSTNPHTPIPNTACPDGQVPNPMVTMTTVVVLTQQEFHDMCDAAGGIFEIQPLCGSSNACRGFAYDNHTQDLTEHTCQATNTCSGYNCVVCG